MFPCEMVPEGVEVETTFWDVFDAVVVPGTTNDVTAPLVLEFIQS